MARNCIFFLLLLGTLSAQDPCAEDLNVPFPPSIINKILEKFKIPPSEWMGIRLALDRQSKLLEVRVQEMAAKMKRNPFTPPVQEVVVGRLYREASIDILREVMLQRGVKSTRKVYEMYDAIQDEKAERLWECRTQNED